VIAAVAVTGASRLSLHRVGPPPGHTGGFGEPTCRACHFDADLNEPGGDLSLGGTPAAYVPGRAYEITVALKRAGMLRGGFQMTARFASGAGAGSQAGEFTPGDGGTQVVWDTVKRVGYAEHTTLGTAATGGAARWTLRWTAPPRAGGPVVFHIAANAANDDDSPLSDFIYAIEATVTATPRP
jgi:hypothetical protein